MMFNFIRLIDSANYGPAFSNDTKICLNNLIVYLIAVFQQSKGNILPRPEFELKICQQLMMKISSRSPELFARYFFLLQELELAGVAEENDYEVFECWFNRFVSWSIPFMDDLYYLGEIRCDRFFDRLVKSIKTSIFSNPAQQQFILSAVIFLLHFEQIDELKKLYAELIHKDLNEPATLIISIIS
jgi:hypothetical protein